MGYVHKCSDKAWGVKKEKRRKVKGHTRYPFVNPLLFQSLCCSFFPLCLSKVLISCVACSLIFLLIFISLFLWVLLPMLQIYLILSFSFSIFLLFVTLSLIVFSFSSFSLSTAHSFLFSSKFVFWVKTRPSGGSNQSPSKSRPAPHPFRAWVGVSSDEIAEATASQSAWLKLLCLCVRRSSGEISSDSCVPFCRSLALIFNNSIALRLR